MENQQEEYQVERITDRSTDKETGGTLFKVKWKGYDEETWEPLENLTSCRQYIEEFEASLKKPQMLID
jgi:hypothetical protein